jgi:hypothetical protein
LHRRGEVFDSGTSVLEGVRRAIFVARGTVRGEELVHERKQNLDVDRGERKGYSLSRREVAAQCCTGTKAFDVFLFHSRSQGLWPGTMARREGCRPWARGCAGKVGNKQAVGGLMP